MTSEEHQHLSAILDGLDVRVQLLQHDMHGVDAKLATLQNLIALMRERLNGGGPR